MMLTMNEEKQMQNNKRTGKEGLECGMGSGDWKLQRYMY